MNVAILGKSQINSLLNSYLENEGIKPFFFEDLEDVKAISGEKGNFLIKYREGNLYVSQIVITEEPHQVSDYIEGINESSTGPILLEESTDLDRLPNSCQPVVFVLDYPVDSPSHMTRIALEKSIWLALKKRKVLFLAKSVRTAGDGLESLYREARSKGVVFFKYDSISINYSHQEDGFCITASDRADMLQTMTSAPVLAGRTDYSSAFLRLIKILKLKLDNDGHINGTNFFLFPSLTSRKGIYFINTQITSGGGREIKSQIEFVLSQLRDNLKPIYKDGQESLSSQVHAEVDSKKCAFCYTCYRACPHLSMAPDYENSVMKNLENSCYGCGICASICPANAITMIGKDNTKKVKNTSSLKVFCCENSGEIALGKIAGELHEAGISVQMAPVACGGELSAENIIGTLKDFDLVLVAVCMDGACRHFEGNKRVKRYVERAQEMLKTSGLDENRIGFVQLSQAMPKVLAAYIKEMV